MRPTITIQYSHKKKSQYYRISQNSTKAPPKELIKLCNLMFLSGGFNSSFKVILIYISLSKDDQLAEQLHIKGTVPIKLLFSLQKAGIVTYEQIADSILNQCTNR